jgi:type III pantothenate kinase
VDLVADIGNSRCHVAAFLAGKLVAKDAVPNQRSASKMESVWDRFVRSLPEKPVRIGIASVNPRVSASFLRWVTRGLALEPRVLKENLRPRLPLEVDAPDEVGADRIADALWAARRLPRQAAVVIDCGTAITLNVVSSRGAFLGGAIAPGLSTQARALVERTALLPDVAIRCAPRPIGRDTASCIASGVFFGAVGLVEQLCSRIETELAERLVVVATGGDAELLASGSKRIDRVVADVTLEGVALALAEDADSGIDGVKVNE